MRATIARFGVVLLVAMAAPASASAASALGHVSVTILPPAASVSFGSLGDSGLPGRSMIAAVGAPSSPATYRFGKADGYRDLVLTGTPNMAVSISVRSADLTGPGRALPFRASTAQPRAASALNRDGVLNVAFGAMLSVARAQSPGSYSGAYTVTVDY